MKIQIELILNKSRHTVWRAFDNPENLARWQPTLLSFKQISGIIGQTGAISRLIYKERSRLVKMTETITLRKEPETFSGRYESAFAVTDLENQFIAVNDNQTNWIMNSTFRFKHAWKLLSPFIKNSIRKRTEGDMLRFKILLEADKLAH